MEKRWSVIICIEFVSSFLFWITGIWRADIYFIFTEFFRLLSVLLQPVTANYLIKA